VQADVRADVWVHLAAPAPVATVETGAEWVYSFANERITMRQHRVGTIEVCAGREIVVTPAPAAKLDLLPLYITGTAMAWILWQRGLLPLHASSMSINGRAAVFLGSSGQGKSTTAAALHARGHAILVDDVTPVDLAMDVPMVHPGFPMLKLESDAVARLGLDIRALRPLHPLLEEQGYIHALDFPRVPQPLGAIFTLVDSDEMRVEQLQPQEALFELTRETYGVARVQHHVGLAHHFRLCSRLAATVPVYRLHRVRSFARLPELAAMVEELVCQSSMFASTI
jgi:hypothetical protein